jgi:hypothetical protein
MKVDSEETGMEVRSAEIFAIFSSHVIADSIESEFFSKSFKEQLKVFVM